MLMKTPEENAQRLADFLLYAQRNYVLSLSKQLVNANVSQVQFSLIAYLAKEDFLTMTEVSKKIGHSTAASTGLIDRMEKLGYVQRLHASDDRRKVLVQVARRGIDLVEQIRTNLVEMILEDDPRNGDHGIDRDAKFPQGT